MFGIAIFSELSKKFFKSDAKKLEDLKLPGFLSIFNENMVATAVLMTLFFGAILLVLGKPYLIEAKFLGEGKSFFFYILTTSLNFAVYLAIFFLRVGWTHVGYTVGIKAIDKVRENSQMIARSATILGITVIGGLIASYVHINVVTSFAIDSTHNVALQKDFFDKVFPNILPMGYTLLMYYLLRVKKAHPVLLIGVTFVLSIVSSALGIL